MAIPFPTLLGPINLIKQPHRSLQALWAPMRFIDENLYILVSIAHQANESVNGSRWIGIQ